MATPVPPITLPDTHRHDVARLEAALLDPGLAPIMEVVLSADADEPGTYEAAAVDGRVRFRRHDDGHGWAFEVVATEGRNPLGDQATDRFAPAAEERANRYPDRTANAYPFAYEQVAQLFDAAAAPDLIAVHSAAHNWEDHGGHRGEHGSIDVIQARAPFIVSGAGATRRGLVPESCRLVDVAPTILRLMGAPAIEGTGLGGRPRSDALLARQDGEVHEGLVDPDLEPPEHVVGILLDGANANVVYELIGSGEAPNLARLAAEGTSLAHGAMSSLPTVTLANHTSVLTGTHPGHHGVLHNAWWNRATGEQIVTNSPLTWLRAMDSLEPGVETLFAAVARAFPGSGTISVNEPCDTGAGYSVFDLMRRGEVVDDLPSVDDLAHSTEMFVRPVKEYRWASLIDHAAVEQFVALWGGSYRGRSWALPRFSWVNFALTDAAFHVGGPHSDIGTAGIRDTDARVGELLAAVERAGVGDRTAYFVVADHGMEESDPGTTGSWAGALDDTGVAYRDEAYGFLYANP